MFLRRDFHFPRPARNSYTPRSSDCVKEFPRGGPRVGDTRGCWARHPCAFCKVGILTLLPAVLRRLLLHYPACPHARGSELQFRRNGLPTLAVIPTGAAGFPPSLANASAGRAVEGSWLDSNTRKVGGTITLLVRRASCRCSGGLLAGVLASCFAAPGFNPASWLYWHTHSRLCFCRLSVAYVGAFRGQRE